MIRHSFVLNKVLQIYSILPQIKFPINPESIIAMIPNCRTMTYEDFAALNNCSISDVETLCESLTGCTHYDLDNDRYLVLYNTSDLFYNEGRQRWTLTHELGHIMCDHLRSKALNKIPEGRDWQLDTSGFESEADLFTAQLLAPFPLYEIFDINSENDIWHCFGLSHEASKIRYKQYLKWKKGHIKTAWENDIRALYNYKGIG